MPELQSDGFSSADPDFNPDQPVDDRDEDQTMEDDRVQHDPSPPRSKKRSRSSKNSRSSKRSKKSSKKRARSHHEPTDSSDFQSGYSSNYTDEYDVIQV